MKRSNVDILEVRSDMQWTSLPVEDIDLLLPEVNDFLDLSNIGPGHPLLGAIGMSNLIRRTTEHDCL